MTVTLTEMIAEAARENEMRLRVYPYRVQQGKLDQHTADRQIRVMEAIREALQRLQDNLPMFRELAKQKRLLQEYPEVGEVLAHFPDADVNIHETQETML